MTAGKTDPRYPELGPTGPEWDTPEQEIEHLRKQVADLASDLQNEREHLDAMRGYIGDVERNRAAENDLSNRRLRLIWWIVLTNAAFAVYALILALGK